MLKVWRRLLRACLFFPSLSLSLTVVDVSILVKCVPSILPQFPRPESIWCCHSYSRWSWPCCTCVALCSSWASVNTWGLIGACIQKSNPQPQFILKTTAPQIFFSIFLFFGLFINLNDSCGVEDIDTIRHSRWCDWFVAVGQQLLANLSFNEWAISQAWSNNQYLHRCNLLLTRTQRAKIKKKTNKKNKERERERFI